MPFPFEIARVSALQTYPEELFDEGPPGLPGFYEFLDLRGIPRETFSREQYLSLAASTEMMYYTRSIEQTMAAQAQMQAREKAVQEYTATLDKLPLDELIAHSQQVRDQLATAKESGQDVRGLEEQHALVQHAVKTASDQIATQSATDAAAV